MIPFDSLGSAISWLDKQGGFTQGLILALVVAAGGGLWTFVKWAWRRVRAQQAGQRSAQERRTQEIEADFENGNAEPGIVDQGVNTTASSDAILAQFRAALDPVRRIFENLFRDTLAKLPENGDPDMWRRNRPFCNRPQGKFILT